MEEKKITLEGDRIELVDVLRGFALAGILYAHMVFWYTGASLPAQVYFEYNSTADNVAMAIFGAFIFGKFFSLFSFLFGLSFYLYSRKRTSNETFFNTYLWRLFLLFLIGIVHHTFWRGDILTIYAVLGVFLFVFRRMPLKILLIISFILITNLPNHLYELFLPPTTTAEVNFPMAEDAYKYYALVQIGNLSTNLIENWSSWPAKILYQVESGRLLMTLGYFLLGLFVGRIKLFIKLDEQFSRISRWNKITERSILALLLCGLFLYLFDLVTLPEITVVPELKWATNALFSLYNACLTIYYITGITLLFRIEFFRNLLKPLAAMGRMALTNYLLQTVFGLLIFYRFGFGLFEKTSPAINVLLGLLVFYCQLKFSQYWLKHFKQGPVEWVWKSMTYFRFFKNKKHPPETATS